MTSFPSARLGGAWAAGADESTDERRLHTTCQCNQQDCVLAGTGGMRYNIEIMNQSAAPRNPSASLSLCGHRQAIGGATGKVAALQHKFSDSIALQPRPSHAAGQHTRIVVDAAAICACHHNFIAAAAATSPQPPFQSSVAGDRAPPL